jgi:hypothetical protein
MTRFRRGVAAFAGVAMGVVIASCGTTADPRPGQEGDGGVPGTAPQQTTTHIQDGRGDSPERDTGENPNLPPTPNPVFPNSP